MPPFSHSTGEHRFISYVLDSSIKHNRRNAEINAANQAAQRQAQVTANQQLISQNPQGLSPNQSNIAPIVTGVPKKALNVSGYQSYDPSTGKITVAAPLGAIDESAVKRLMESGMTEGEARDRVTALRPEVRNTMSNTGLQANGESVAGAPLTAEQYADSIVSSLGDPRLTSTEAKAEARQQALQTFYEKQRADEEMKRNISERNQRQMSSVGYNQNAVNDRLTSRLTKLEGTRGDFVDQKRAEINPKTGKIFTDQEIRSLLQGLPVGTFSNEQAPQQQTQSQSPTPVEPQPSPPPAPVTPQVSKTPTDDTETMQKDKTIQGSQVKPQAPVYPPQASAVRDMMTQLAKDNPLVGLFAAMYDEDVMRTEQAKANALLSLDASIQGAEQEDLDTQAYIDKWVNIANQNSSKLTGILQSNNEETNKILEEQKNNALQKLEFDRQVQTQQMEKQKAADVLKSSIAIGLRGGAYSGAAQNVLADSEREWDTAIQNLGKEYSFKAADVMTDYTAKYVTAKQNLALNLFQASEAHQNKIEGYANAGFSSIQAKKKAITEAKNDYRSTLDKLAQDNAKETKDLVTKMAEMVNKKRDDERAQEQLGINMLDKLVDTYGSNVPPSLLETVKKYIPNIDIQDVMKRKTLAQTKKGAGGGLGGLTGFSFSQKTPTGKPQTLEQFIETKQKDFNKKMYGPASPEMRKEWEKEYQAKLAIDTTFTAEQLMKEWTIKRAGTGNFPNLGTMKAVEADFHNALKAGDLEFARHILDGIGPRPVTAIAEKVTTTQQLVADLDGMENLLDEIEQKVGAFPTKGKLWTFINENIETTPEYARLRQYVDTNLTPYARTVSGERGASTEPDVQRAMSSLLDPNVDAPALRAALAQAKKRAAMSSTLLLKNLRDSGYRVNALQEGNDKFMNQYQQEPSNIPQSTQDWFNKY